MFTSRRQRPRRGIILLVALGLLALFGILIAAYLTFASDSRRAAFNNARRDFRVRDPEAIMHEAMMQLIRGTTNPNSAAFRQDLLGDYYGYQSNAMGALDQEIERITITAHTPIGGYPPRNVLAIGGNVVKVPVRFTNPQPVIAGADAANAANVWNNATLTSPVSIDDALAGRTVTFLQGPLAGHTLPITRWMGLRQPANTDEFESRYSMFLHFDLEELPETVVLPNGEVRSLATLISGNDPTLAQDLFYGTAGLIDPFAMVINPQPLNGSGSGVRRSDGQTQVLTQGMVNVPIALQPNTSRWWTNNTIFGNADEPYDAPDYENWFLSYTDRSNVQPRIIPSFHRPAVINFLQALVSNRASNDNAFLTAVEIVRRATLRPIPVYDPNNATAGSNSRFTGGNSSYFLSTPNRFLDRNDNPRFELLLQALVNGPWDVDNDGDGIADSIWIDLQLPLQTAPDGTRLRPMVAVKIEDLSAKFNVNAHGNAAQLTQAFLEAFNRPLAGHLAPGANGVSLPSGRGYGPAEIFPLLVSGNSEIENNTGNTQYGKLRADSVPFTALDNLLSTRYSSAPGVEVAGWTTTGTVPQWQRSPLVQPGIRGFVPGEVGQEFQDNRLRPNLPQIHTRFTRFGYPLDLYGRGGFGLDASGNLFSSVAGAPLLYNPNNNTSYADEALNDPYELDPSGHLSGDSAFRLTELDALLNHNRWDGNLHAVRLRSTLDDLLAVDPSLANLITTYSTSEVRPAKSIVPELRDQMGARLNGNFGTPPTLLETVLARVVNNGGTSLNGPIDEADLELAESLIAPELKLGKRININRPLGNGLDDNGNGVIDEPREIPDWFDDDGNGTVDDATEGEEREYGGVTAIAGTPAVPRYAPRVTANGAVVQETSGQALARHLYCTLSLLMSSDPAVIDRWVSSTFPNDPDQRREYVMRRIAQWAVNVVDYRDGDGIMTRFIYDVNPFDGWSPDLGQLANGIQPGEQTREVWGCEHPELLFAESFASHDLRVKDTTLDQTGELTTDTDPTVDQLRMPQGSAILELYNARAKTATSPASGVNNFEAVPSELYSNVGGIPHLDLGRMAPAAPNLPAVPVWRVAVSQPHPNDMPPNNSNFVASENSPLRYRQLLTDTASFDPTAPSEVNVANVPDPLRLERFVVFHRTGNRAAAQTLANRYAFEREIARRLHAGEDLNTPVNLTDPTVAINASAIFHDLSGQNTTLPAGDYLTIAPRTVTHFGVSRIYDEMDATLNQPSPLQSSNQRYEVVAGQGLVHFNLNGTTDPQVIVYDPNNPAPNANTLPSQVFLAQAFTPEIAPWGALAPNDITRVFGPGNLGVGFNISEPVNGTDYYRLPENYLLGAAGNFTRRDAYYDFTAGEGLLNGNPVPIPTQPADMDADYPIYNLTRAFGGANDPFLGTAQNYCTAFLQRLADPTLPFQPRPDQPNYNPYRTVDWIPMDLTVFSGDELEDTVNSGNRQDYALVSRQRNGRDRANSGANASPRMPGPNLLFSNRVNDTDLPAITVSNMVGTTYFSQNLQSTLGYLSPEDFGPRHTLATAGNIPEFIGQPQDPTLAMHHWLNRPFASPMEVMFVPACSQARLLEEFGLVNNANAYAGSNSLADNPTFGHLLNFLDSAQNQNQGSHLYRIFDFIGTGPKYRGDAMPMSPLTNTRMTLPPPSNAILTAAVNAQNFWREAFLFPNNHLPNFIEHGRINLNTIEDQRVYAGLMWAHLPANLRVNLGENQWTEFLSNRRGYVPGGGMNLDASIPQVLNPNFPTEFAKPFLDGVAGALSPELPGMPSDRLRQPWIGGTVARPRIDGTGNYRTDQSLFGRATTGAHDNVDRNALMRNQTMTRMSNLVTANSNSYLIRLTMGYFAVEPVNFNLGREYLSEFGRNERFRATYIIDRSIPCNYVTGLDNDTEKLILYRRYSKE